MQIPKLHSSIGIYLIMSPSGKAYVGQSKNLRKRLKEHKRLLNKNQHSNIHLQNSYNKHQGIGFFSLILEYTDNSSKLTEMESWWISKFDSFNKGFNQTIAADSSGMKRSEETKAKISKVTKSNWETEEFRVACFNGRAEYLSKEESRKRMSETTYKVFRERPELAENHSVFMKVRASSQEYKENFKCRMESWRKSKTKDELSAIAIKAANSKTEETYEISKLKAIITRAATQHPSTGILWVNNKTRKGEIILTAMVRWKELNGKSGHKSFSVSKYGMLPAWEMAVSFRKLVVERLVKESHSRLSELQTQVA